MIIVTEVGDVTLKDQDIRSVSYLAGICEMIKINVNSILKICSAKIFSFYYYANF